VIEQLVAAELLAAADDILPRQRETFRVRRDALAAALPSEWRFALPQGGLCLWVELDAPRSTALAAVADRHGVRVAAGPRFGVDGAFERFVRLPYTLPEPVLEEAVSRLAVAWRAVSDGAPAASAPVALVA
jgi:DNA-binding transcriptional MocR family regulator